ncbi:MAG: sugar transferase [Flavisolibacter sp.]
MVSEKRPQVIHISPELENEVDYTSTRSFFFKRVLDIILSFFILTFILSWLLPVLAIMILMDSRGPVFFVQKRVGAGGKVFRCYKLRTMYVNHLANVQQAQANDPRITSFGKFLRLSCLDELPQFLNVLIGNMSIVGPRPHMLNDCKEFSSVIKNYGSRSLVKPGITGMAQVKGFRGKTNDYFDVAHRYKWDMFYIRNCSMRLDMQIIKLTVSYTLSTIYSSIAHRRNEKKKVKYQLETPEYLN